MKRDQLNDTYLDLIEKQRLYFKTVKDFKEVSFTTWFLTMIIQCLYVVYGLNVITSHLVSLYKKSTVSLCLKYC